MAYGVTRTQQEKDEMIETLRPYLQLGMTVTGACRAAGLPKTTINDYIRQNEEQGGTVRLKINAWRSLPSVRARHTIVQKIMAGDVECSKWWLIKTKSFERSEREMTQENRVVGLSPEQKARQEEIFALMYD